MELRPGLPSHPIPDGIVRAGELRIDGLVEEPLVLGPRICPWRLVVPGDACFTSVKWVDRIELAAEPGEGSGERIARARLGRNG